MPHPQRKTGVAFFYLSPVFPKGGEAVRLLKKRQTHSLQKVNQGQ